MIIDCKYLLDGRCIGRPCIKNPEEMSCRYYGNSCFLDEQKRKFELSGNVKVSEDDGYPD